MACKYAYGQGMVLSWCGDVLLQQQHHSCAACAPLTSYFLDLSYVLFRAHDILCATSLALILGVDLPRHSVSSIKGWMLALGIPDSGADLEVVFDTSADNSCRFGCSVCRSPLWLV
jgi:hypothetical protein